MEQKKAKFRFHLNLFDCIVILAALAVAALLVWSRMKPQETVDAPAAAKQQYTILLRKTVAGTGELVEQGDALVDAVKNFDLGRVVSSETKPAVRSILNEDEGCYVTAEIPGYEDIYIVVESTSTVNDSQVLLGSGYEVRVGNDIFVRGPGYLGSGKVYAIERGE